MTMRSSVDLGIVDDDVEHEPVQLRLRQRVGPLLLERVLGRQHEERRRQREDMVGDGDLALLHGFEQGRLGLGWRTVDLVGQEHVGEDGPLDEAEGLLAGILVDLEHVGADDVRRHQVRGELDALELQPQDLGQGIHHQRLAQPRQADHQTVAAGGDGDQEFLEDLLLADDGAAELGLDLAVDATHVMDVGDGLPGQGAALHPGSVHAQRGPLARVGGVLGSGLPGRLGGDRERLLAESGVEDGADAPELDRVAAGDLGAGHLRAVDEDAVGALQVLDVPDSLDALEGRMVAADAPLVDAHIALVAAADDEATAIDLVLAAGVGPAEDLEFGHGAASGTRLRSARRA
jgi:hypothetical protein